MPGQTSQSLQISAVTLLDSGNYSVQISNAAGSVVSSEATVSITDLLLPPEITAQPQSLTVNQGAQIALAVTATGSLPLSFQWYKNGLLLTGRTAPSLLISSASTADAGSYTVRVSNLFGSDESDSAIVSVQAGSSTAPRIITQPQAIAVNEGSSAALSVEAEGQPVLQFAWFKNGQSLPGETSPILSFSSITKAEEGTYSVRVSNSFGTASSDPANVVVFPLPRVTLQPESVAVRLNNTLLLTVVATSSTALGYQWFKDGVEIPGATAATYRVLFMQATDTGSYQVRVSNNAGSILSQEAVVTIAVAPQITQQPVDTTVNEGTELHLSFQASGSGPFLVEWVRNNVVVQVTNKTELTLSAIKPADAGSYAARVSGPGGTVSTAPVTVRVEPKPVITLQPQGAAVQIGASVTLAVSATGNGTLVYQWFKDGQLIPGAEIFFWSFLSKVRTTWALTSSEFQMLPVLRKATLRSSSFWRLQRSFRSRQVSMFLLVNSSTCHSKFKALRRSPSSGSGMEFLSLAQAQPASMFPTPQPMMRVSTTWSLPIQSAQFRALTPLCESSQSIQVPPPAASASQ